MILIFFPLEIAWLILLTLIIDWELLLGFEIVLVGEEIRFSLLPINLFFTRVRESIDVRVVFVWKGVQGVVIVDAVL